MSNFNTEILALTRESRGYTQAQLSDLLGVEQGTISKIENGRQSIKEDLIEKIATILDYPKSLFYSEKKVFRVEGHYRKKVSLAVKDLKESKALMTLTEWQIDKLINAIELPRTNIPSWDIETDGAASDAAMCIRENWKIPRGRVGDLAKIIEDNGIIIAPLDLGDMDALATYSSENHIPIIYINKNRPADRIRFNLAHELAHYTLHFGKTIPAHRDSKTIEDEANDFASELLLPSKEIAPYLTRLNIEKLAELKQYWKVSMGAILFKAKKMELITQHQYEYILKQMSALGYRKKEPVEIEGDKPTLLKEIIDTYIEDLNYQKSDLAAILDLNLQELDEKFFGAKPRYKTKMFLRRAS